MDVKIIYLLFIGFISCQVSTEPQSEFDAASKYLSHYGYMRPYDIRLGSISHGSTFQEAIREFQEFANLKITGDLNNDTIRMMKSPRCGVKDKKNPQRVEHSRFRRYVLHGSKWDNMKLTYRITKYPTHLGKTETDADISRAFEEWSKVSPLTFSQITYGRADIEIRFESRYHDDDDPFDGPGGTLAHARFPAGGGDVHFDDQERWTINSMRGTNLFRVAVHEFGHSLGLEHSNVRNAIMYPFYRGPESVFQFHQDDIDGIQAIYGEIESPRGGNGDEEYTPRGEPPEVIPRTDDNICKDGKLDAIFKSVGGSIYILKGSSYWYLSKRGLVSSYPRPISERWIGLPSDIDAAFSSLNGRTYFFKGSKYYRYSADTMDRGYPKEISDGFPGIPSNIDAAMWVHHTNKGFFFKGDKYWVFTAEDDLPVKSSYPQPISNFKGTPSNLDDVLNVGGKVYFFKDGWYYKTEDFIFETESTNISPTRRNVKESLLQNCF